MGAVALMHEWGPPIPDPRDKDVAHHNATCLVWFMLGHRFRAPPDLIYNSVDLWAQNREDGGGMRERVRRLILSSEPTHALRAPPIPDRSDVLELRVIEVNSSSIVAYMYRDEIFWHPRDYSLPFMNAMLERYELPRIVYYTDTKTNKPTFEWRGDKIPIRGLCPIVPPIYVKLWRVKNHDKP